MLDCVIVGAGPAGLVAALYLRRFHRQVRVVDAGAGRARRISRSNNVAGFPDGISGPDLLSRMERHLNQVGGQVSRGNVCGLQLTDEGLFDVQLAHEDLKARTVLLCTGVRDRLPAVAGAAAIEAAGLLRYCPVCDGYEHTGKRIGVLGNSPHGVREAAFLRHFSSQVRFIAVDGRGDELGPQLQRASVAALPGKPVRLNTRPQGGVAMTMENGDEHRFDVLYAALGIDPGVELTAGLGVRLDELGNIVVDDHGRTSVDGLYAAGDVVRALDQISVAAGQAAIAASAIHRQLWR
ncbi:MULTISPECIES: NAD(P)/FAD-dependent oxidoreductase [unclassified Roseateles]|uniref:NAD(P)/FAD-dependent oxidoreductase n=1 Tax=unclassified Roseateles TaxID=2626991 RepID=UPI00138F7040|nr:MULTISPECIES: NAD(P)/FAD-dependent oxidoreductase [unclassified Roseateles]